MSNVTSIRFFARWWLTPPFLFALAALPACGNIAAPPSHPPTALAPMSDNLYRRTLPKELADGSANLLQAQQWAAGVLGGTLRFEAGRISPSLAAIFMSNDARRGSGGNTYLVFDRTPRGIRYLGHLDCAAIAVLAPDPKGRPRVATFWHMSSNEGALSELLLTDSDFEIVRSVTIHPGDGGTPEGNFLYNSIFGPSATPDAGMARAFDDANTSR